MFQCFSGNLCHMFFSGNLCYKQSFRFPKTENVGKILVGMTWFFRPFAGTNALLSWSELGKLGDMPQFSTEDKAWGDMPQFSTEDNAWGDMPQRSFHWCINY